MYVRILDNNLLEEGYEDSSNTYFIEGINPSNIKKFYYDRIKHEIRLREYVPYKIWTEDDIIFLEFDSKKDIRLTVTLLSRNKISTSLSTYHESNNGKVLIGFRCDVQGSIIISNNSVEVDFENFELESTDCDYDPNPEISMKDGIISIEKGYYGKQIEELKKQISELKGEMK